VTLTSTAVISSTGNVAFDGAGTKTLQAPSTYTGATTINAGTVKVSVATVAGTSSALGRDSAVTMANVASAILSLNGFDLRIGALFGGGTSGGNVSLGANNLTTNGATNSAYAGAISGSGMVTKIGLAIWTVSGASSYSGVTNVNGGT